MTPRLYTFRRCPYAIRARLAIAASGVTVEMHEVDLRHKPAAMLACSPKGTVPVLQLADGRVIDESLDIMRWALSINDACGWLGGDGDRDGDGAEARALLAQNDGDFKRALDRYKYAGRYPQHPAAHYRTQAEIFLTMLDDRLAQHHNLLRDEISMADMAILPFVRQFAHVDRDWFHASPYGNLMAWLDRHLASAIFNAVMQQPTPQANR